MYDPRKLLGTACWSLTNSSHKIKGASQALHILEEMGLYQAELFGLYCFLIFIKLYCDYFKINSSMVGIAFGFLSAVTKSILNKERPKVLEKNHNLLLATFRLCMKMSIELEFWKVYGHQDIGKRAIDKCETLNCECDLVPKCLMLTLTILLPNTQHQLYGLFSRISKVGRFINGDIMKPIYRHTLSWDIL